MAWKPQHDALLRSGAAPMQVRAMAEAFSALPARVLWKLTPGEADALGNASLASNVKACTHVSGVHFVCYLTTTTPMSWRSSCALKHLPSACVCWQFCRSPACLGHNDCACREDNDVPQHLCKLRGLPVMGNCIDP